MALNDKVVTSEASYYVCVTQDVLAQLDTQLQQLKEQNVGARLDDDNVAGKKVNRVMYERLPKLLQRLWHEICQAIIIILEADDTSDPSHENTVWTELGELCSQLAVVRAIYKFVTAELSGKAVSHGRGGGGGNVELRSVGRLLHLRGRALASPESQQLKQWVIAFVLELHQTVVTHVGGASAGLDELQKQITAYRETACGSSHDKREQQQREHQHMNLSTVNVEIDVTSYSDEEVCKEHLKFFWAACIDLADDLTSFVKHHVLGSQSSPSLKQENCDDVNFALSDGKKADTDAALAEVFMNSNLTSGADRWVFFRIRPNDTPPLTLEEVSFQVRSFYQVYNAKKSNMAPALADGYGWDYADLFDSLEYRYCYTTPTKAVLKARGTAPREGTTLSLPSEERLSDVEVHEEANERPGESDKTDGNGGECSVM